MPYSITSQNSELFFFPESSCIFAGLSLRYPKQQDQMDEPRNLVAIRISERASLQYVISVNTERLIQRPLRYTRRLGLWPAC